jgi:hypothetical protein
VFTIVVVADTLHHLEDLLHKARDQAARDATEPS